MTTRKSIAKTDYESDAIRKVNIDKHSSCNRWTCLFGICTTNLGAIEPMLATSQITRMASTIFEGFIALMSGLAM